MVAERRPASQQRSFKDIVRGADSTVLKRFEEPDKVRRFEKGTFELVHVGGMTIGRATYEPGWKWSEHVGPGLGATRFLLVMPIVVYHLLSAHTPEQTIYYYYAAPITPVIFLASVQTLKKFRLLYSLRRFICWLFIVCCCVQLYAHRSQVAFKLGLNGDSHVSQEWQLVEMIPSDAGVVATFKFLPALSLRKSLYSFYKVYDEEYQNPEVFKESDFYTGKMFKLPGDVSWALIDFND